MALGPPEPFDRVRALARFGCLSGRAVRIGFTAFGPIFRADTPERLTEAFAEWIKTGPAS
jgi:hypothetical protein